MNIKLENWDSALSDLSEAIRLGQQDGIVYSNRAAVRLHFGDLVGALEDCNQAIQLDPKAYFAYTNRGCTYLALGQYDLALNDFKKAEEIKPDDAPTLAGLAITYHALGQTEEAVRLWQQLIDRNPNYKDANWVQDEHQWTAPLVEEARKLIASL